MLGETGWDCFAAPPLFWKATEGRAGKLSLLV